MGGIGFVISRKWFPLIVCKFHWMRIGVFSQKGSNKTLKASNDDEFCKVLQRV